MESTIADLNLDPASATEQQIEDAADRLDERDFHGILLIAPPTLGLDRSESLPVEIFDRYLNTKRLSADFHHDAVIVATRLESGETLAGTVFRQRDDEIPSPRTTPDTAVTLTNRIQLDVRQRIEGLPWRPGTYSLAVLLFDERSNPARVELSPGLAASSDPAVIEYLKKHRGKVPPPDAIWPPPPPPLPEGTAAVPRYRADPKGPLVPEEPGIGLSVERVALYSERRNCVLRGSFRLPLQPRNVVPPRPDLASGIPPEREWRQVGDAKATAVVPITLVVQGSLSLGTFVIPLKVPSYDAIDPAAENPVATGSFQIDLFHLEGMPKTPQTFYIWAVGGEAIGGPAVTAYVTQDMFRE